MPPKARKRCYYFDPDGNPVEGGCPRTSRQCRFVHPDDEWWPELRSVQKPLSHVPTSEHWLGEDQRLKDYNKERAREKNREKRREKQRRRRLAASSHSHNWSHSDERRSDNAGSSGEASEQDSEHERGFFRREQRRPRTKEDTRVKRSFVREEPKDPPYFGRPQPPPDKGDKTMSETAPPQASRALRNGTDHKPPMTPTSPGTLISPPKAPRALQPLLQSPATIWNDKEGHSMDVDNEPSGCNWTPSSVQLNHGMNGNGVNNDHGKMNGNGLMNGNGHMNGHNGWAHEDTMDVDSPTTHISINTQSTQTPSENRSHSSRPIPARLSIPPTPVSASNRSFSIPWNPEPPPPSAEAPIPPPPPLPEEPECFRDMELDDSAGSPVSPVDKTLDGKDEGPDEEERWKLWNERVSLMADAVMAQDKINRVQEEIDTAREILAKFQRSSFSNPSTLADITNQLTQLQSVVEEAQKEADITFDRLVHDQRSWPVLEQEQGELIEERNDQEDEARYKEMVEYVKELKVTAEEMRATLMEIVEAVGGGTKDVEFDGDIRKVKDDEWGDLARVIPGQEQVIAPPKSPSPPLPPEPTEEEQEEILSRLTLLESTLFELRDLLSQHDTELVDSLEGIVDMRVDDYIAEVERKLMKGREREHNLASVVDVTAQEAEEIEGDLKDMEMWLSRLDKEIEVKKKKEEVWKGKQKELMNKMSSFSETHAASAQTLQALRAELHTYLSQPPSPPPSPPPASQSTATDAQLNYILSTLSEPIKHSVRSAVMPIVEGVRNELENFLRQNNNEVQHEMGGRLDTTKQVMEVLYRRLVLGEEGMPGAAIPVVLL